MRQWLHDGEYDKGIDYLDHLLKQAHDSDELLELRMLKIDFLMQTEPRSPFLC